jgi:hypothetical protein
MLLAEVVDSDEDVIVVRQDLDAMLVRRTMKANTVYEDSHL